MTTNPLINLLKTAINDLDSYKDKQENLGELIYSLSCDETHEFFNILLKSSSWSFQVYEEEFIKIDDDMLNVYDFLHNYQYKIIKLIDKSEYLIRRK